MAITFKAFHDSALTSEITSGNPMLSTHTVGATDYTDDLIYIGSNASGTKLQAVSDPGVDPVVVSVADAGPGSGAPASEIKLALSSGGLASAVAGASLDLSATLLSGVANAVPVHVRRTSALSTPGAYTDVSLLIDAVEESAV